jgi:hypothetical protein
MKDVSHNPLPFTTAEALAIWDSGKSLISVSMGGLGLDYEQAIQKAAFELIRVLLSREPIQWINTQTATEEEKAKWMEFSDSVEDEVTANGKVPEGISGAMWEAAENLAYRTSRLGWPKAIAEVPDRWILVKKGKV